jgi:hypothetical protein
MSPLTMLSYTHHADMIDVGHPSYPAPAYYATPAFQSSHGSPPPATTEEAVLYTNDDKSDY